MAGQRLTKGWLVLWTPEAETPLNTSFATGLICTKDVAFPA